MKSLLTTIMTVLLVSCGYEVKPTDQQLEENQEDVQEESGEAKEVLLQGYISSAFSLTVDGELYNDSEDFYTHQLDKLHNEMIADGYEDYDLHLDAELGLKDLKKDMKVYAAAQGDEGYAAEKVVDFEGKFKIQFPAEARGSVFQIRVNKRIGVRLVKGDETIRWCYNFYAQKELPISDKPVILKEFFTKLTKYKCKGNNSGSLRIPEMPGVPVQEAFDANDQDVGYGPKKGDNEPDIKADRDDDLVEDIEEVIEDLANEVNEIQPTGVPVNDAFNGEDLGYEAKDFKDYKENS